MNGEGITRLGKETRRCLKCEGTTLEAAEELGVSGENDEKHPAGAEARVDLTSFAARLKSCPDTCGGSELSFFAACEVVP